MSVRKSKAAVTLVLLAATAVLTAAGCGGNNQDEVWVLGVDGADWDQLDPMIARGELPNLARLRAEGAAGVLRSDEPMISPILWTSIATGKTPDLHGVTWFMTDAPDGTKMPISSMNRRVRTFWNIASEAGLSCGVVGWWATWPADPIEGYLVSDYVGWHSFGVSGRGGTDEGKTWPPEFIETVEAAIPSPLEIPTSDLQKIIHLPPERLQPDPSADPYADPPAHLRQAMATSRGYTDLVLRQLEERRSRLLAVYYEGTDAVTHLFGDFQEPRLPWVSDEDFAAYRDAVSEYWKWQDELLGELLAKRGPRTTVVVVSDHGFRIGDERLKRDGFDIDMADADHMPDGVIIINGPGVRAGATIRDADIYDVAPTVLYALGLPVAADMHGRVLSEAFTEEHTAASPIMTVPTYETSPLARADDAAVDKDAAASLDRMLKSLGYVGGGSADEPSATVEQVVNLSTVLMRQGRPAEAVTALQGALADHPGHPEIRLNLAQALARSGDQAAAEKIYRELVAEAPEHLEYHQDLAVCLAQFGDYEGALAAVEAGLAVEPDWLDGLAARGNYLFHLGRTAEARRDLERAVDLDPRHADALFNLGQVEAAAGNQEGAAVAMQRAYRLEPGNQQKAIGLAEALLAQGKAQEALDVLNETSELVGEDAGILGEIGVVLLRTNRPDAAVAPLKRSRELDPSDAGVAGNLGMAYAMTGDMPAAIASFEDVVALDPELTDGRMQLGMLYFQSGQLDAALRELRTGIEQDPDNARFRLLLGSVAMRAGKEDEARQALRAAIELDANLAPAYFNLGQLEQRRGQTEEGKRLIARALELDPSLASRAPD